MCQERHGFPPGGSSVVHAQGFRDSVVDFKNSSYHRPVVVLTFYMECAAARQYTPFGAIGQTR